MRTQIKLFVGLSLFLFSACGTLAVDIERSTSPGRTATPAMHATIKESDSLGRQGSAVPITPTLPWVPEEDLGSALIPPPPGLVYHVSNELWKVGVDGSPVQIFSPNEDQALYLNWHVNALLSSRGEQVLYWDWETNDLWLADLVAGLRRNLTNTPGETESFVRWWPGRTDTVLFSSIPRELGPVPGATGFLGAVRVDGGGYQILDDHRQTAGPPAPSPDGQTIAYSGGSTGWLYHWETGPEVFDPSQYGLIGAQGGLTIGSPAWSPDGKRLAWVVEGEGLSSEGRIGVGVFDLDAQTAQLLHPYKPPGLDGWLPSPLWGSDGQLNIQGWLPAPLWSPDGRWLAFVTVAQNPAELGLWVLRADGQTEKEISLAIGRSGGLAWSPDSRGLVLTHTDDKSESSTWLIEVGTWHRQQVDLAPGATVVDWLAGNP